MVNEVNGSARATTSAAADASTGLTASQAAERLARYGENTLTERHVSALERLARFFWGPIPWMIEAAAILSAAVGHWEDLAVILAMLLVNAGVGFWQEFKADNAIALLKKRLALRARVRRDGVWKDIEARLLVPGDLVSLKLGGVIPADVKLAGEGYLSVDQSALTGESLPVDKKSGDDVYSGSIAKLGDMVGVVTATGMDTYFGKTAGLVQQAASVSHFQRAVLKIGNFLILTTIGLVAVIGFAALFRHDPLLETAQFALILAVASIPVALPAVLSVTMAVGAERLARLKAIVSRLVAIEEMAGMDILCTDKTGTLTKNELTLGDMQPRDGVSVDELVTAAALASSRDAPDAIDVAVLKGAKEADLNEWTVKAFRPFDPVVKRSYAIYRIAETMRILLFMTASILIFNFYPVTAIMVVLLALLNDVPIMMIAYDNAPFAPKPVRWDMNRVLAIASVLGVYGVFESFGLFWIVRDYLGLPAATVQSLVFLKLLVSGHMTIYLTRNKGSIWERPWPSWKLVLPCEATQIVGTLAVVYGWFMAPTGWSYALLVWAYALVFFVIASAVKIAAYHMLEYRTAWHVRHLGRVERHAGG